jgi:ribonuclease E
VLRGLEEEGEKNRAAAVTVKIGNDVAIYILNQKRHELSRIETEHGMEISFVPADSLATGSFELERTKSRDPGDRPRNAAVSIEAGFVPSSEPEPDYVEEVEEQEEFLDTDRGQDEPDDQDDEERPAQQPHSERGERGERDSKGRRRRRGGRGRNRDRDRDGPRPTGADTGTPAPIAAESAEGSAPEESAYEPAVAGAPLGENGEPRRKRRRRRGRRGGRDRADRPQGDGTEQPQAGFAPDTDRFGAVPDEIDTTPMDGHRAPMAATLPVWTPTDDIPDTTPQDDPNKPVKKGWWQRTFSGE